jgi:hypothetical protein
MSETQDSEIQAMTTISKALDNIKDKDTQQRILNWIADRFELKLKKQPLKTNSNEDTETNNHSADYSDIGEFSNNILELHFRDVKANNANNAAIRLCHIVAYLNEKILGEKETSSKDSIVPMLKEWNIYNSNTRRAIAKHHGLKRRDNNIVLDPQAKKDAENYIKEIRDNDLAGKWQRSNVARIVKKKPTKKEEASA